jgi:hypothetical protein
MPNFKISDFVTGVAVAVGFATPVGTPGQIRHRKGSNRIHPSATRGGISALRIAQSRRDAAPSAPEPRPAATAVDHQDAAGIARRSRLIMRWQTDRDGALVMMWTCEES